MATSTMPLPNGGSLFEGQSSNSSGNQPNGQASTWSSNNRRSAADSWGARGYGGQRPRGRGGYRGRRRGSRFRGGRGRLSDMRTNGQSDHDTIKQPDVDLRASLSTFYEKQRTKEFPPLLKVAEQISSEVESEIREFLRKNVPNPDHARFLTLEDFRQMGLSETAIAHLDVVSKGSQEGDMFTVRRLSGTIGLQMQQWERYFDTINQLHALDACSLGAESEAALKAIDETIADLDEIHNATEQIAEMCKARQLTDEKAKTACLREKMEESGTLSKVFLKMGLVCGALGLGVWCFAKVRG